MFYRRELNWIIKIEFFPKFHINFKIKNEMTKQPKILIVDDEKKIRLILSQILADEGYLVSTAENGEKAILTLSEVAPDLILMDQKMPGMNGIEAMTKIKAQHPDVTVIIITAHASLPLAVEATKKGAYDYISKPFDNDELLIIIRRALQHTQLTEEVTQLKQQLQEKYSFKNIIGTSSKMQRVFEQIARVCETNATVLVQGESGAGKEMIVKAIHYHSKRREKPFIAINCGAVPINLLESEFFGHEKGAFTDAKSRKIGKFEQANSGTLFLDEIGELPLDAQVKLLRVLDERKISRIGGHEMIPIDVRVISATNKNPEEEVKKGTFRLDLLYRLNIFTISVPPLRERKDDIPLLVEHFIQKYNQQMGLEVKNISQSAITYLQNYDWPGNVRDLENAIQSAMILAKNGVIRLEDLPIRLQGYPEMNDAELIENVGLEGHVRKMCSQIEKEIILKTLESCDHNRTITAETLQISRKTLFNKMKQYRLE